MDLTDCVREYIGQNLTVYDEDYTLGNSDPIFELGFVDSMFAVQLVTFLEQTTGITVRDTDLNIDNFSSVNRIVEFVNRKQQNG